MLASASVHCKAILTKRRYDTRMRQAAGKGAATCCGHILFTTLLFFL